MANADIAAIENLSREEKAMRLPMNEINPIIGASASETLHNIAAVLSFMAEIREVEVAGDFELSSDRGFELLLQATWGAARSAGKFYAEKEVHHG